VEWPLLWWVVAAVVPPTVLGGWMGGWLTGRISTGGVRSLAAWVVGVTGVFMVVQGVLPLFFPGHSHDWEKITEPADRPSGDADDD
jgi:hypothetical protein